MILGMYIASGKEQRIHVARGGMLTCHWAVSSASDPGGAWLAAQVSVKVRTNRPGAELGSWHKTDVRAGVTGRDVPAGEATYIMPS